MDLDSDIESLLQKWSSDTQSHPGIKLKVPLREYLEEANELAVLADHYLEPQEHDGHEVPGLSQVIDGHKLTWEVSAEIRQLVLVIGELQARDASQLRRTRGDEVVRARKVLSDWMAALKFLFQQRDDRNGLATLRGLRRDMSDQSHAMLAQTLSAVALLAEQHLEELSRVGRTREQLDECLALQEAVRRRSGKRGVRLHERRMKLAERDRLLSALDFRVQNVRRAFRFVFRDHPQILRLSQSAYARKRRRKYVESKQAS